MFAHPFLRLIAVCSLILSAAWCPADDAVTSDSIVAAVERAMPPLQRMAAGSAEQRQCFTCHGQAMAVIVAAEAARRGFAWDPADFSRQVDHTYAHTKRGKKSYEEGKGQGGRVDMAGYALWTLEDGDRAADELTDAVVDYILGQQNEDGHWNRTSNRPPSEASSFTTTYLALRSINAFARDSHQQRADEVKAKAANWLTTAKPNDTEDHVFYVLSFDYVDVDQHVRDGAVAALQQLQRDDGGWGQTAEMDSDAYATGTALYALHRAGMSVEDEPYQRGLKYLLDTQLDDGSWHVVSRSKPFQKYFETGFPHGKDQFISATASAWATVAMLFALPQKHNAESSDAEDSDP